jgi:hypothetical protein
MSTYMQDRKSEQGQVLVLAAILMSVFLMVSAFALDGGYGLYQSRAAQNAADFGAMAGSKLTACNASSTVTAAQMQSTIQNVINDNDSTVGTNWTAKYLDGNGNPISGATFSGTTTYTPPANACGISLSAKGTWNANLSKIGGFGTMSTTQPAGALGSGTQGVQLAIASLLPYARHTIYATAVGQFTVQGSMFDNSAAQCENRTVTCTAANVSTCMSGTPVNNIICYGDSADVFESASENITGTLYSVAPVATDPCFYPSPMSGVDSVMSYSDYSSYYNTYGCSNGFSSAANAMAYGGISGNSKSISDPLANLADPSGNGGAATECPGQSTASTYTTSVYSSGNMTPGVYNNPVVITGSVNLLPCESGSTITGPGIYVFKQGIEICPASSSTVTGSDVMLFASAAPSSSYSNATANSNGYCVSAPGSGTTVTDGIHIGGMSGATVTLSAPDEGVYKGILLYQSRSTNLNIGLDDGYTNQPGVQTCTRWGCSTGPDTYTAEGATINLTGVVYDNSFSNEPSDEVFSVIGSSYGGPYGALCTGSTSDVLAGSPTPCPGIATNLPIDNTSGAVTITGAVVVGAFGTMGGDTDNPMALDIIFNSNYLSISAGNLKLIF